MFDLDRRRGLADGRPRRRIRGAARADGRHRPPAVEEMEQGEDRMSPEHAGPGVAHDFANQFPLAGTVAVNGALNARRLALLETAALEPDRRIVEQLPATRAKPGANPVPVATVKGHHRRQRAELASQSGVPELSLVLVHSHRPGRLTLPSQVHAWRQ